MNNELKNRREEEGWYVVSVAERRPDNIDIMDLFDDGCDPLVLVRVHAAAPTEAVTLVSEAVGLMETDEICVRAVRISNEEARKRGKNAIPTLAKYLADCENKGAVSTPSSARRAGQAAVTLAWYVVGIIDDVYVLFEENHEETWCRVLATDADDAIARVVGALRPVVESGRHIWAISQADYDGGRRGAKDLPTLKQLLKQQR